MTHDLTTVPTELLHDLRTRHRSGQLDQAVHGWWLRPLTGGRNNHVYAWDSPEGQVCLKLYRIDKRDRAGCEWQALNHLAAHDVPGIPAPLWYDPDLELPAVAMSLLPGTPVPQLSDARSAISAVIALQRKIRNVPLGPFAQFSRADTVTTYLRRVITTWPEQLHQHPDESLTGELLALLNRWRDSGDTTLLGEVPASQRVLSRGDSNLLNWHWHEPSQSLGVVDFEFAGYSDTAFDAADLLEHPGTRELAHQFPDEQWEQFLPELGVIEEHTCERFRAAQRLCALRWLAVLWKRRTTRSDDFHHQLDRVRALCAEP